MRRRRYANSETELLQKLKSENQRLKRERDALRKQLARVDLNQFQNLKETIDSYDRKDQEAEDRDNWECWTCRKGVIRLAIIERRNGAIYNRVCDNCGHKTKFKKYSDKVKR